MPSLPPTIEQGQLEEEEKLSWLRTMWRFRHQFQAMSAAAVVFVAGGMKLAWIAFEPPSRAFLTSAQTHRLIFSWLAGIVIGCLVAGNFVQRHSKNIAHCASGALLLFGGALVIGLPTHYSALLCSCLCEGIAYGLTEVQALVTGGEVAAPAIRGLVLASERICLWFGVCLQLACARLWFAFERRNDVATTAMPDSGYDLYVDQLHGLLTACLGLLAVALALLYRHESPVLLQWKQRELAAVCAIQRLLDERRPSVDVLRTRDTCRQLCELEAVARTTGQPSCQQDLRRLLLVLALRCFATLSLTLPFNRAFLTVSATGLGCDMNCLYVLAVCGLAGSLAGGLLIDKQGRRRLAVLSLLFAAICVLLLASICEHVASTNNIVHSVDLALAAWLMAAYQLTIAMGVAVAAAVYLGEAFAHALKAPCIASAVASEQLLALLLTAVAIHADVNNEAFFFAMGVIGLLLGLLAHLLLPETKGLPLHKCLLKFQKVAV